MRFARRLGLGMSLGVLLLSFTTPVSAAAPPITTGPQSLCSKVTPSCGTNCTNTPFELMK